MFQRIKDLILELRIERAMYRVNYAPDFRTGMERLKELGALVKQRSNKQLIRLEKKRMKKVFNNA